jgi:hypothetical protein
MDRARDKRRCDARKALLAVMVRVARTARVVALTEPGTDAIFRVPVRQSDATLLAAARTFLHEGEARSRQFVSLGLPKTFTTELGDAVAAVEAAIHDQRAHDTARKAARARFDAAMVDAMHAVRTLDVVVSNTVQHPADLHHWAVQRRIRARRRAKKTQTAGTPA